MQNGGCSLNPQTTKISFPLRDESLIQELRDQPLAAILE